MQNFISYFKLMLTSVAFCCTVIDSFSQNTFTQKDRETLIELKLKMIEMDKHFEQIDKRFDDMYKQFDKRFDDMYKQFDKRFEGIDHRFSDISWFLGLIATIFTIITTCLITLVFWDRKTFLNPVEVKVQTLESSFSTEKNRLENLLSSLKELSKTDINVAKVLKQFNIL